MFALEKELIAARNADKFAQTDMHREAIYRAGEAILEDKRDYFLVCVALRLSVCL
jgi:hypothetical protein